MSRRGDEKRTTNRGTKKKRVRCHHARLLGILGIIIAFWILGYVSMEISAQPFRAIPVLVLWGLMGLGVLFDTFRLGKEGRGGLVVIVAGVEFFSSLPLFGAGLLFYLCGKKRKKVSS